uniref:Putative secreted protein n=1 Tax=Rhipicephalus microplus TaxID=6941 RepID=A0A6M2D8R0_RHIMP
MNSLSAAAASLLPLALAGHPNHDWGFQTHVVSECRPQKLTEPAHEDTSETTQPSHSPRICHMPRPWLLPAARYCGVDVDLLVQDSIHRRQDNKRCRQNHHGQLEFTVTPKSSSRDDTAANLSTTSAAAEGIDASSHQESVALNWPSYVSNHLLCQAPGPFLFLKHISFAFQQAY